MTLTGWSGDLSIIMSGKKVTFLIKTVKAANQSSFSTITTLHCNFIALFMGQTLSPAHWTGWQAGLDQRSKGIWYQLCLFITSTSVQKQQAKFMDDSHVCLKSLLKPNGFFLMPPRHRNHSVFTA